MSKRKLRKLEREIDEVTGKIKVRMRELGEEDVMSYRDDKRIHSLIDEMCGIYREGYEECQHANTSGSPLCGLFLKEPEIIKRLELTEETVCPIARASKKKK